MQKKVCFFIPLMFVCILLADVDNPDKPKKGEWDFQLEEVLPPFQPADLIGLSS